MTNLTAQIAFMQKLQALDLDDLDRGLEKMSVEAANLFPMINDNNESDGERGNGAAYRAKLLADSIYRVEKKGDRPALTLEQDILISDKGDIIDGRNRVKAIIRNFGLPVFDYDQEDVATAFNTAITAQGSKDAIAKMLAGEDVAPAYTDADLLFRHIEVVEGKDGVFFDHIVNRNLARRDLTTSQRGCVAANVSAAGYKRMAGATKMTDALLADSFGIGHKTLKRAKALKKDAKDLFQRVLDGEMSAGAAEAELRKRQAPQSDETTEKAPKAAKPKADVTTTLTYGAVAIKSGIQNEELTPGQLFDAISEGLEARMGASEDLIAAQDALAKLLGVELA